MQVIEKKKKGFIKNDRQDLGDKKLALEMLSSSLLKTSRGVTGIKTERTRGTGTKGFSSWSYNRSDRSDPKDSTPILYFRATTPVLY